MKKLIVSYVSRESEEAAGSKTYVAKTLNEAAQLAATYKAKHPELKEKNYIIVK